MDGPPPPRRYSRGPYDDDRPRSGPPPSFRDHGPYDRPPPPPPRGGPRRDDYDRGPPMGRCDEGPGGLPPPGFDRRRLDSPEYEARKRRRSLSPGGPPRGGNGRAGMDYPPRDYRDGPPPPGHYRDEFYDRRGPPPPPRGGPRYSGPPPPGYAPPAAGAYGELFPVPPPPHRPMLEAPLQLPHRVSHAYFSDWFHAANPGSLSDSPDALEDAWKKYCADFNQRELRRLFEATREHGAEWFREKYAAGAEAEAERRERRDKGDRRRRVEGWVEKADKGELDALSFDFDEELARKPRIQPNAATQAAAAQHSGASANGTSASPEVAKVELPVAASPVPDAGPLKASSPEYVVLPARPETLVVQGVPPTVKYKELEAVFTAFPGFVRLALGEPQPHARFFRTGWAVFATPEAAATALETVRAAAPPPPLAAPAAASEEGANSEERMAPSAENASDAGMKPVDGEDAAEPSTTVAAATMDVEEPSKMDDDPATTESAEPASPYLLAADTVAPFDLRTPGALLPLHEPREVRVRAAPAATSGPDRVAADLVVALAVVDEVERRLGLGGEEGRKKGSEVIVAKREAWEKEVDARKDEEGFDAEAHKGALAVVAKRTLDLAIAYLREAHDVCFYCCAVCESPEQLTELCPRHVRRCDEVRNPARDANELAWVQGFDAHVPLLQDVSALDVRDFGALSRDKELYRLTSPHLKQEEEGKFRCKSCNKLFSARKFVEKHIGLKHAEIFGDQLNEIACFNNYALDPTRLPQQQFQRENYLPSILNPPPPPPPPGRRPPLTDRLGPPHKRSRREREPRGLARGAADSEGPPASPAPPPKGAALDPRAQRGATAYADLDGPAGGGANDVVLPY